MLIHSNNLLSHKILPLFIVRMELKICRVPHLSKTTGHLVNMPSQSSSVSPISPRFRDQHPPGPQAWTTETCFCLLTRPLWSGTQPCASGCLIILHLHSPLQRHGATLFQLPGPLPGNSQGLLLWAREHKSQITGGYNSIDGRESILAILCANKVPSLVLRVAFTESFLHSTNVFCAINMALD